MKSIIIIGAGSLGREVYRWLLDQKADGQDIEIEGFYDRNHDALKGFSDIKPPILGTTEGDVKVHKDKFYLCSIGFVDIREMIFEKIKSAGGRFFTAIHPSARVGSTCSIGEGSVICPNVILTDNVSIANNVLLNLNVICGHDVKIGDHAILCPMVNVNGNVIIENNVFIGSSAVITPGVKVAKNSKVSAGSVVYKSFKSNVLIHGNPAKVVKTFSCPDKGK